MKKIHPPRNNSYEDKQLAFNYSIKYLSLRSRTIKEVFEYLLKKGFLEETINETLKRLMDLKFLNDDDYAVRFVDNRQSAKGKSKLIIKIELRSKGINDETIEKVLADANDDYESAKIAYRKKAKILSGTKRDEFKKKMMSYLARRGFSWEVIKKVIAEID